MAQNSSAGDKCLRALKACRTHVVNQLRDIISILYCTASLSDICCSYTWILLLSASQTAMLSVAVVELALVEVQTAHTSPDENQMCPSSVPVQHCSKCSGAAVVTSEPHTSSICAPYACTCTHMLTALESYEKMAACPLFCTAVAIALLLCGPYLLAFSCWICLGRSGLCSDLNSSLRTLLSNSR